MGPLCASFYDINTPQENLVHSFWTIPGEISIGYEIPISELQRTDRSAVTMGPETLPSEKGSRLTDKENKTIQKPARPL